MGVSAELTRYSLGSIVGREAELSALHQMILHTPVRLVTVTGPIGVGKTRLAVELFEKIRSRFGDDGFFIDLTEVRGPVGLDDFMAAAVGTTIPRNPENGSSWNAALDGLKNAAALLIIDNCEHLLGSLARLLTELLSACPHVMVVTLSRQPLRVYGESLFRLSSLPVPSQDASLEELLAVPAAELFLHRAKAARPGFSINIRNAASVAGICARLDGLPLAIEMAAARVKLLSPSAILTDLTDHLAGLRADPATTMSRHRDMGAAVAESLQGLSADEEMVLTQLAVFAGEFTLGFAEAVVSVPTERLHTCVEALVDKSILLLRELPDGELDFSMLQVTREYVYERLRRAEVFDDVRRRYIDLVCRLVKRSGPGVAMRGESWPDYRQAYDYLLEIGDAGRAAALLCALSDRWTSGAHPEEGIRLLEEVLRRNNLSLADEAAALFTLSDIAIDIAPDPSIGRAHRALSIFKRLGDDVSEEQCRQLLARGAYLKGDLDEAARLVKMIMDSGVIERSAALRARTLLVAAQVQWSSGKSAVARSLAADAYEAARSLGDVRTSASAAFLLAELAAREGDHAAARERYVTELRGLTWPGDQSAFVEGLETCAVVLAAKARTIAQWNRVVRHFAAACAARRQTGTVVAATREAGFGVIAKQAMTRLGPEMFNEQWEAGMNLSPAAALAELVTPPDRGRIRLEPTGCPASGPLTEREYEVAELVAKGLTNREIGRRLAISEWTVANHLRKVMRKLNCSSRVQVARWVVRRGGNADPAS